MAYRMWGCLDSPLLSGNEHDGVEKPVAVKSTRLAEPGDRSLEKFLEAVEH